MFVSKYFFVPLPALTNFSRFGLFIWFSWSLVSVQTTFHYLPIFQGYTGEDWLRAHILLQFHQRMHSQIVVVETDSKRGSTIKHYQEAIVFILLDGERLCVQIDPNVVLVGMDTEYYDNYSVITEFGMAVLDLQTVLNMPVNVQRMQSKKSM